MGIDRIRVPVKRKKVPDAAKAAALAEAILEAGRPQGSARSALKSLHRRDFRARLTPDQHPRGRRRLRAGRGPSQAGGLPVAGGADDFGEGGKGEVAVN